MERRAGTSKLVYNKTTRTIDTVRPVMATAEANAAYLRIWATDIRNSSGASIDADRLDAIACQIERLQQRLFASLIETAPRDGRHIVGLAKCGWREMWVKRDEHDGEYWMDYQDSEPEPTHWIELPDVSRQRKAT